METLEELFNTIFDDIKKRNSYKDISSIPHSDKFAEMIAEKYNIIPFTIPKIIKILVDSHKIFSFIIVEADRNKKIRRVDGYIITKIDTIKSLLDYFEGELDLAYSIEFTKKLTIDKITRDITSKQEEFNNTKIGILTAIVVNLKHFSAIIENNIMDYSDLKKNKLLENEISKMDTIEYFISSNSAKPGDISPKSDNPSVETKPEKIRRKEVDPGRYEEYKKNSNKYSLEETLNVYGVEFYTRVCFREYRFSVIKKLVDTNVIRNKDELKTIKILLRRERANSDRDLNLQKFAQEINDLEKSINIKLK